MNKLIDNFGRRIDYLRVSITDKCNLRCQYCMPAEGVDYTPHEEILRHEEIVQIIEAGANLGITKIRLTGGEPLLRKGIVSLVEIIKGIEGIEEVAMTTNGILLKKYAKDLVEAGLDRVNISLDTLRRDKFKAITRRDKFSQVMEGIEEAFALGLDPVKLNVVLIKGFNDDEIFDFIDLTRAYPLHLRFIEFMPLGEKGVEEEGSYMSIDELKKVIEMKEQLLPTEFNKGNGPAYYYKAKGALGSIGFISPVSNHFCGSCNRLRLTSKGGLRSCLFTKNKVSLRDLIRDGGTKKDLIDKILEGVNTKDYKHSLNKREEEIRYYMSQIGG